LRTERLRALAAKINLPVDEADKGELNSLTNNATHQGCVLEADPLSPVDLRWLGAVSRHVAAAAQGGQEDGDQTLLTFDAEGMTETSTIRRPATPSMPLWLALDQVVDPQVVPFFFSCYVAVDSHNKELWCHPAIGLLLRRGWRGRVRAKPRAVVACSEPGERRCDGAHDGAQRR